MLPYNFDGNVYLGTDHSVEEWTLFIYVTVELENLYKLIKSTVFPRGNIYEKKHNNK